MGGDDQDSSAEFSFSRAPAEHHNVFEDFKHRDGARDAMGSDGQDSADELSPSRAPAEHHRARGRYGTTKGGACVAWRRRAHGAGTDSNAQRITISQNFRGPTGAHRRGSARTASLSKACVRAARSRYDCDTGAHTSGTRKTRHSDGRRARERRAAAAHATRFWRYTRRLEGAFGIRVHESDYSAGSTARDSSTGRTTAEVYGRLEEVLSIRNHVDDSIDGSVLTGIAAVHDVTSMGHTKAVQDIFMIDHVDDSITGSALAGIAAVHDVTSMCHTRAVQDIAMINTCAMTHVNFAVQDDGLMEATGTGLDSTGIAALHMVFSTVRTTEKVYGRLVEVLIEQEVLGIREHVDDSITGSPLTGITPVHDVTSMGHTRAVQDHVTTAVQAMMAHGMSGGLVSCVFAYTGPAPLLSPDPLHFPPQPHATPGKSAGMLPDSPPHLSGHSSASDDGTSLPDTGDPAGAGEFKEAGDRPSEVEVDPFPIRVAHTRPVGFATHPRCRGGRHGGATLILRFTQADIDVALSINTDSNEYFLESVGVENQPVDEWQDCVYLGERRPVITRETDVLRYAYVVPGYARGEPLSYGVGGVPERHVDDVYHDQDFNPPYLPLDHDDGHYPPELYNDPVSISALAAELRGEGWFTYDAHRAQWNEFKHRMRIQSQAHLHRRRDGEALDMIEIEDLGHTLGSLQLIRGIGTGAFGRHLDYIAHLAFSDVSLATRRLQKVILIITEVLENLRWDAVYANLRATTDHHLFAGNTRNIRERITWAVLMGHHPMYFPAMLVEDERLSGGNYVATVCLVPLADSDPRIRARISAVDLHANIQRSVYQLGGDHWAGHNPDYREDSPMRPPNIPLPSINRVCLVALMLLLTDALRCLVLTINFHALERDATVEEGEHQVIVTETPDEERRQPLFFSTRVFGVTQCSSGPVYPSRPVHDTGAPLPLFVFLQTFLPSTTHFETMITHFLSGSPGAHIVEISDYRLMECGFELHAAQRDEHGALRNSRQWLACDRREGTDLRIVMLHKIAGQDGYLNYMGVEQHKVFRIKGIVTGMTRLAAFGIGLGGDPGGRWV
jgi:hypothetical protein